MRNKGCMAHKPMQAIDFMVEKTYHLLPYLVPFDVYLMPQCTKYVPVCQSNLLIVGINLSYIQYGKKTKVFVKNKHKDLQNNPQKNAKKIILGLLEMFNR